MHSADKAMVDATIVAQALRMVLNDIIEERDGISRVGLSAALAFVVWQIDRGSPGLTDDLIARLQFSRGKDETDLMASPNKLN